MTDTSDHAAFERAFDDYHDHTLGAARAREVEAHLAGCERCRAEYEKLTRAIDALSGLHKVPAPPDLPDSVAQTINRRSAGRFFGRKAFGDRIPYELLAIVGLVIAVAVVLLLRFSLTGSAHDTLRDDPPPPREAPGARDVLPRP